MSALYFGYVGALVTFRDTSSSRTGHRKTQASGSNHANIEQVKQRSGEEVSPNSPVKPEYHKYEQCNQSKVLTWVGERSNQHRSHTVRSGGAIGSENAGMSSEKASENLARRKPKVS